jgi:hypothetical protein
MITVPMAMTKPLKSTSTWAGGAVEEAAFIRRANCYIFYTVTVHCLSPLKMSVTEALHSIPCLLSLHLSLLSSLPKCRPLGSCISVSQERSEREGRWQVFFQLWKIKRESLEKHQVKECPLPLFPPTLSEISLDWGPDSDLERGRKMSEDVDVSFTKTLAEREREREREEKGCFGVLCHPVVGSPSP